VLKNLTIGIDTGGTFTDITVLGEDGNVYIDKAPTTPDDFSRGVIDALSVMADRLGGDPSELLAGADAVKHGTTVATNALINRDGARVGLITTKGFEDTTLIMRAIGRVAGLSEEEIKHQAAATKPAPIVPKALIRGVRERIGPEGEVIVPLNEQEARDAARSLIEDEGVEAIAVNLLWSFANPEHERRLREILEQSRNGHRVFFTISSELVPVIREYARSNTVVINAFLGRLVQEYLAALEQKLASKGYAGPLLVMQANGGIVRVPETTPIGTLGSGPSGGIIASQQMSRLLSHDHVITADMGGTSFDVGLITDGHWLYLTEPVVERFHITWPMIDVESIGAGGGTICTVDPTTGSLKVGPRSAGGDPGPICYGRGGSLVTVSDVDVVLGYLNPEYFLGGRMRLDREAAEEAVRTQLADPLGLDPVEAAAAVYDIVNAQMADLIRKKVVAGGRAPEEYAIYAFGGAGPVHAAGFAAELGVREIYVFPTSSVFSALGIAMADVIHTKSLSARHLMPADPKLLNARIEEVETELLAAMSREGFAAEDVSFRRTFDMRYRKQLSELEVPVPAGTYSEQDLLEIMDLFERRYEGVYGEGTGYREMGIEVVSMRIDAVGETSKPVLQRHPLAGRSPAGACKGSRSVHFAGDVQASVEAAIYDYERLEAGNELSGPAIIETPITTVVVPPGQQARVDAYLNTVLTTEE
jgi:N-methylhydantoinase A